MNDINEWAILRTEWSKFVADHPELAYQDDLWAMHNFLRIFRADLVARDAIRKARGRHWIAHTARFPSAAFECATGFVQQPASAGAV